MRVVIVDATRAARTIADYHSAQGMPRMLMGEALSGALLLAAGLKSPGTLQLRFNTTGDLSLIAADATPMGLCRAMIPQEELENVAGFEPALLPQTLTVRKRNMEGMTVSEGVVEMSSMDLSQSLSHYLAQSEQARAYLRVGTVLNEQGELHFAGGFLVEAFPNLEGSEWMQECGRLGKIPDFSEFCEARGGLRDHALIKAIGEEDGLQVHQEFEPEPYCPCSREGMFQALSALGRQDLAALLEEQGQIETHCEFCRRQHLASREEVEALIQTLTERDLLDESPGLPEGEV
jgi:molecular chaperone Hsp33